jgi:O-glycosyl hydrolase
VSRWADRRRGADPPGSVSARWISSGVSGPSVVVDPGRTYQTIAGFGASITASSAAVLSGLRPAARDRAMASLFAPRGGDGLDYLRQPIGASDFTDEPAYTYDDVPAGRPTTACGTSASPTTRPTRGGTR